MMIAFDSASAMEERVIVFQITRVMLGLLGHLIAHLKLFYTILKTETVSFTTKRESNRT